MPRKTKENEEEGGWEGHGRHDHMCCGGGKIWLGLFILLIGVSWLGHDLGWWSFTLPWFPIAVTLVGLSMVFGWMKHRA